MPLLALLAATATVACQRPPAAAPLPGPAPPAWPAPASLWLPPPDTDAGVLVRMLIAESKGPAYGDYDEREAYFAMQAMKAVVHNRLFSEPSSFGAGGARTYADVICAPGQWSGFGRSPTGQWTIEPALMERVDAIVGRANDGVPGPFHRFVRMALDTTYGGLVDPFAHLVSVDGRPVRPGAYGWRREGSSPPGGSFLPIARAQGGVLGGNQFYAWALR